MIQFINHAIILVKLVMDLETMIHIIVLFVKINLYMKLIIKIIQIVMKIVHTTFILIKS
jgi:hypothetical protein